MDVELIMVTISAIAAAIAALISLVATIQNHKSIKLQELERHAMMKPQFVVTSISADNINRNYKFDVVNIGYDKLNNLVAEWKGNEKAEVKQERYLEVDKSVTYVIELSFNPENSNSKDIKGQINIIYINILGKKYIEDIKLVFNEINDDITGANYLILKEISDKHFN